MSVALFDPMLEEPEDGFPAALAHHRPRIVAVYEDDFNFLSKMCLTRMRELAWHIAGVAQATGAIAIVHGSDSTDNPELFLKNGFDYVCCGEAEESLAELCRSILQDGHFSPERLPDVAGLVWLDAQGQIVRSAQRLAKNSHWSELQLPARDLIDFEPYRAAWRKAHGYFSTNIVSSRGCPYHCNWCAKPISGNRFQLRSPSAVAEEMRLLKVEVRAEHLWFGDDIFGLNHQWMEAFSREVVRRDAAIPFKIQSRANLMTERTVLNLKAAGCAEVWMGVESGSQAVLDAMDKGLDVRSVRSARQQLKQAGIRACYFLQFGYPGETWIELQETINLVRDTQPDDIGVSFSYPLPGTVFYERVHEQLGYKRNWSDSDDLCILYKGAYKTDFYRAVRDALHAEVDSWKQADIADSDTVTQLWKRVADLEPVSKEATLALATVTPSFTPAGFVSLEQLAATRSL